MFLNKLVLLVEESDESRAIVPSVAFCGKNELPALEFLELRAFEKNLESLPDERSGWYGAVNGVIAKREPGPDGLINVYH